MIIRENRWTLGHGLSLDGIITIKMKVHWNRTRQERGFPWKGNHHLRKPVYLPEEYPWPPLVPLANREIDRGTTSILNAVWPLVITYVIGIIRLFCMQPVPVIVCLHAWYMHVTPGPLPQFLFWSWRHSVAKDNFDSQILPFVRPIVTAKI